MSGYDLHHALDVASRVSSPEAKVVALLHDAIEDGVCDYEDIRAALGAAIADDVVAITRQPDESYSDYIDAVKNGGPIAVEVKIADLRANMARADVEHASLQGRYRSALKSLTGGMT